MGFLLPFDKIKVVSDCIFAVLYTLGYFLARILYGFVSFYFNDDYNNTFGLSAFLFGVVLCAIHRRTIV